LNPSQAAVAAFGGIDFFFNNAGILGQVGPFTECSDELFDRVVAANVRATWMGMKLVAPVLISRGGGSIVNTASIAGLRASPGLLAYSVSKHAVVCMTRSAAAELAPRGVRVNAICPAPINTPMGQLLEQGFSPGSPQAFRERMIGRIPMARYGSANGNELIARSDGNFAYNDHLLDWVPSTPIAGVSLLQGDHHGHEARRHRRCSED